ncbi:hypothetical protein [Roseimicrobium gellanilyticum]|nr:hypothetical protein [Roseimicrobium gellanilyticum]
MPLYKEPIWWAWLATVILIGIGLAGYEAGFHAAISLSALQIGWLATVERSLWTLPVQIRIAYTLFLVGYEVSAMRGFYWFTALGTVAFLLFGYCLLARMLSLLPWNRLEPLTIPLVRRTFLSPPAAGNVHQGMPRISSPCQGEANAGRMAGHG